MGYWIYEIGFAKQMNFRFIVLQVSLIIEVFTHS